MLSCVETNDDMASNDAYMPIILAEIFFDHQLHQAIVDACKEIPLSDYPVYWDLLSSHSPQGLYDSSYLLMSNLSASLAKAHQILIMTSFAADSHDRNFPVISKTFASITNLWRRIHNHLLMSSTSINNQMLLENICIQSLSHTVSLCSVLVESLDISPYSCSIDSRLSPKKKEQVILLLQDYDIVFQMIITSLLFSQHDGRYIRLSSNKIVCILHMIKYDLVLFNHVPRDILSIIRPISESSSDKAGDIEAAASRSLELLHRVGQTISHRIQCNTSVEETFENLSTLFMNRFVWQDVNVFPKNEVTIVSCFS